jgi:hypothetical protein
LSNLVITVAGLATTTLGLWLQFGAGYALITAGSVLFVTGGLGSARERRGA